MSKKSAELMLMKQLKELNKTCTEGFSAGICDSGNVFEWDVLIMGPPDTP